MTVPKDSFIIPTAFEIVAYIILAVVILSGLNYQKIVLNHEAYTKRVLAPDALMSNFGSTITFLNSRVLPTVVTAATWALIGMFVYIIVWYIGKLIGSTLEGERTVHTFVFPNKEERQTYQMSVVGHVLARLVATILLILWAVLLFTQVIPFFSKQFALAFVDYTEMGRFIWAFAAPVLLGVYLFLGTPLARAIALKPRVLSS